MRPWVEKLCEIIKNGTIVSNSINDQPFIRSGEFEIACNNLYTITIKRYDAINYITIYQEENDIINKTINRLKEKQEDELINNIITIL